MAQGLWLCSIEDQRQQGAERTGLLDGFSLGNYLLLLDETSRLVRPGKASLGAQADGLFDRLGTTREEWEKTLTLMFNPPHPKGVTLAFTRKQLREAAKRNQTPTQLFWATRVSWAISLRLINFLVHAI
jgi:hypothetical protein